MWPIFEDNNPRRIAWGEKKRACYDKFIRYAIYRSSVELPTKGDRRSTACRRA
jgi:hypothetical protein